MTYPYVKIVYFYLLKQTSKPKYHENSNHCVDYSYCSPSNVNNSVLPHTPFPIPLSAYFYIQCNLPSVPVTRIDKVND